MKITNKFNYPDPIYQAVLNNIYNNGGADISVTSLIDAPRPVELLRRHSDDIEVDVSDLMYSLMGNLTHTLLEQAGVTGKAEQRLHVDVKGWDLSGQFDYIDDDGILWDWKTVSVNEVMKGVKDSREKQLNVYAFMARACGYSVTGLRVGFIFRDWRKGESYQSNYPPHQSLIYPIKMWDNEEAERYINERIELHQGVRETGVLPECSPEERWQREDKWAVHKSGATRATKLFDSRDDGDEWLQARNDKHQFQLVKRDGISVRCGHYCVVNNFCDFYQQLHSSDE